MVNQILASEWSEVCNPIDLCYLPFGWSELSKKLHVNFIDSALDGMGLTKICFISVNGHQAFLRDYLVEEPHPESGCLVQMLSFEPSPATLLNLICESLSIGITDLKWVRGDLGQPEWAVVEKKSNADSILVWEFHEENVANFYKEKLRREMKKNIVTERRQK